LWFRMLVDAKLTEALKSQETQAQAPIASPADRACG